MLYATERSHIRENIDPNGGDLCSGNFGRAVSARPVLVTVRIGGEMDGPCPDGRTPAGPQFPGPDVVIELSARHSTAVAHFTAKRYKEALPLLDDILTGCQNTLGVDHPYTVTVAGNLGVTLVAAGKRRAGVTVIRSNLADRVRLFGDEDPRTLTARDALAVAYRIGGDVDGALTLSRLVTAQRVRRLGLADPATLTSRMGLALAEAAAGDVRAADAVLISAIGDAEEALGPRHTHTIALVECGRNSGLLLT